MDPKELSKKVSEQQKRLGDLESKRSEVKTKRESLQEQLEDRTLSLFDRALRAMGEKGQAAKQKNQKIYDALKESEALEQELTSEIEELKKDLTALEISGRRLKIQKIINRGEELLKEGQVAQLQGGLTPISFLKECALIIKVVEMNQAAWQEDERVDYVRVIITDPVWRARYLPYEEQILYLSKYAVGDTRIEQSKPKDSGEVIYEILPYKSAMRLQKAGKCSIDHSTEKPEFEKVWRSDPEPEILKELRSINFGEPVTINGQVALEFKELAKKNPSCPFRLTPNIFSPTKSELESYAKNFGGNHGR